MRKIIPIYHDDSEPVLGICRVDFIGQKIGKINRTDEGYLSGTAAVAKVGVMAYFLSDGTVRRELVTEDTLFNPDSMATLRLKPITDQHPPETLLDSKTVKRRKVGFTGETVCRDGDYLVSSVVVTDDDAVVNVDEGRRELSPGYHCDLLLEPGTFNGQPYDAVQLSRRYNHLALCDRARGGSDLRLNLDGITRCDGFEVTDAILSSARRQALPDSDFCYVRGTGENKVRKFPAHDAAHVRNGLARLPQSNLSPADKAEVLACLRKKAKQFNVEVSTDSVYEDEYSLSPLDTLHINNNQRKGQNMPLIRIDNIDYEAAQEVINHLGRQAARADKAEADLAAVKSKLDAAEGERDGLKTKVSDLEKIDHTTEIQKGIMERITVLDAARKILDDEAVKKLDAMSIKDIKISVIKAKSPEANLDGKSDEYVNARYDAVVENIDYDDGAVGGQRQAASRRQDANGNAVEKARLDNEKYVTNAYKDFGGTIK